MPDDQPRSVAAVWADFRRTVLHGHADGDPALAQAKTVFYSGALGCFRVLCHVLATTENDADVVREVERFGEELEHWGKVQIGEIKVQ